MFEWFHESRVKERRYNIADGQIFVVCSSRESHPLQIKLTRSLKPKKLSTETYLSNQSG